MKVTLLQKCLPKAAKRTKIVHIYFYWMFYTNSTLLF